MRFGKSAAEAAEEPGRGGGGGDFIRYLKDGDTTFRILQEPDDWTYWWEHFSPMGFSFPCPRGVDDPVEDCPGCSSDNEKMSKVNRKIGFNVLASVNGVEYVNAFKVGPTVADKLKNRFNRFSTVTDRDYTITRYKTGSDRWDFDVEGGMPSPVDVSKYELKDLEELLAQSYDEAWGDGAQAQANRQGSAEVAVAAQPKRPTIAPQTAAVAQEEPPFEAPGTEKVYQEADLRKMDREELLLLIKNDLGVEPPSTLTTPGEVVDWLMSIQP